MAIVEYVYSAHSAFAYVGSTALMRLCEASGATLVHKPILLSPVVEAQGGKAFRDRSQAHVDYFFGREIARWAEHRGVPIVHFRPTHHDADYQLASGMIFALGDTGPDVDALAHRLLEAHWRDDADLSDPQVLSAIASELGHDADTLLGQADSAPVRQKLSANTAWAIEKCVFGSPTYIVDGDPFYGQDRLELVERAIRRPFEDSAWVNPPVA